MIFQRKATDIYREVQTLLDELFHHFFNNQEDCTENKIKKSEIYLVEAVNKMCKALTPKRIINKVIDPFWDVKEVFFVINIYNYFFFFK